MPQKHLPSLPKQTPRVELESLSSSGSPDPRHLHNQQFQPSRADSSGGKGGCACWGASCPSRMLASGPSGPPQGLRLHRGDCAFIPVLSAPPPSSLRPARTLCKHRGTEAGAAEGPRRARAAFRTQLPALASLAPRRPPEEGQPSNLKRHSPGATPPRAGEGSHRWQRRFVLV